VTDRDLIAHLARFAHALREAEIPVRLSDELDAVAALPRVDIGDRGELLRALVITLKIRREQRAAFHAHFDAWWTANPTHRGGREATPRPSVHGRMSRPSARDASGLHQLMANDAEQGDDEGQGQGFSPEVLLRRKPFEQWTDSDLALMDRIIARLALRLATRRSRRRVPTRGRGTPDVRRSLRETLGTGGDLLALARRTRPIERPRLLLLCDTSGSMDPHTKFLLTFVLSLGKIIRSAEIFVFNTELTRITRWVSRRTVHRTLERLGTAVPDWSGGTRIGDCLATFVDRYLKSMVNSKTVVVILSDGLDRSDPNTLVRAMRAIHRAARTIIWLNPLMGDDRYEPTARGMKAALPHIDLLASAHDLESLQRILPSLAA